jgi:ferric-dicitrate binding protein FerR (iron transport regulator)
MSEAVGRSQRLQAYAETFGEPDHEASARLRERVRQFMHERDQRRRRWRHWLQAAAVTAIALSGATVWALRRDAPIDPEAGAIVTDDTVQTLELSDGRIVLVAARTRLQVVRDDEAGLVIALEAGEIELGESEHARPARIDCGEHAIALAGDGVRVRQTGGVPMVVVRSGAVQLSGPGLPAGGVRLSAARR